MPHKHLQKHFICSCAQHPHPRMMMVMIRVSVSRSCSLCRCYQYNRTIDGRKKHTYTTHRPPHLQMRPSVSPTPPRRWWSFSSCHHHQTNSIPRHPSIHSYKREPASSFSHIGMLARLRYNVSQMPCCQCIQSTATTKVLCISKYVGNVHEDVGIHIYIGKCCTLAEVLLRITYCYLLCLL